jgi:hypothetical protein
MALDDLYIRFERLEMPQTCIPPAPLYRAHRAVRSPRRSCIVSGTSLGFAERTYDSAHGHTFDGRIVLVNKVALYELDGEGRLAHAYPIELKFEVCSKSPRRTDLRLRPGDSLARRA